MSLLSSRAEEYELIYDARARVELYRLGAAVLVTVASGHASARHIARLTARSDELIARAGRISVVHDWFGITGYDAEVRTRMTPWALKTRHAHAGIHIGIQSQLVHMGVSMVRMATGAPIHACKSLSALEVALADALRLHGGPRSEMPPRGGA